MSCSRIFLILWLLGSMVSCRRKDCHSTKDLTLCWTFKGEGRKIEPKDFVLFSTYGLGQKRKQKYQVEDTMNNGIWPRIFVKLRQLDSIEVSMKLDSLDTERLKINYKKDFEPGQEIKFGLMIHDVLSKEEHYDTMKSFEAVQIRKYIKKQGWPINKLDTNNSFYLHKKVKKELPNLTLGQKVKVDLNIFDLKGNIIQSSHPQHGIDLNVSDTLLPGVKIALLNMAIGEKANVIIPFDLAFKDQQRMGVRPFTTLFIKLEVLGRSE